MSNPTIWLIIGFGGQACFFMRFLVQWIVSEKKGKSTIPTAFWFFSIIGSFITLAYAIYRKDPVFIVGQSTGSIIYIRNLMLIHREKNSKETPVSSNKEDEQGVT